MAFFKVQKAKPPIQKDTFREEIDRAFPDEDDNASFEEKEEEVY